MHLGDVKGIDHLGQRHNFALILGTPAQKGKKIHEGFRQITFVEEVADSHITLAFAEFFVIRV